MTAALTGCEQPTGRVTCGPCAVRGNVVNVCTLRRGLLGRVVATCPVCGHSEVVVPK